jgi:biotin carboxylase
METTPLWAGIDVAKDQLDVAMGGVNELWSVPNDDAGIQSAVSDLRSGNCRLVAHESGVLIPTHRAS